MNHIIACTLGLLGAGAFCAHGESPAIPAAGQPVPQEKGKSSLTPGQQGNAQEVKKSVSSAAVSSAAGHASCVDISAAEPEKAGEIKNASYSVTARGGAVPGEVENSVTPKMGVSSAVFSAIPKEGKVFLTRNVAAPAGEGCVSCVNISASEPEKAGEIKRASYSVTARNGAVPGEMEISVTPKMEVAYSVRTTGKGSSGIIISTVKAEKADGVKEAAYSITTAKGAVPGGMEVSVVPVKEEASSGTAAAPEQAAVKKEDRAVVQIALLLDTSGSMTGLINQARTYLWKIVNDMTLARQNGKLPDMNMETTDCLPKTPGSARCFRSRMTWTRSPRNCSS